MLILMSTASTDRRVIAFNIQSYRARLPCAAGRVARPVASRRRVGSPVIAPPLALCYFDDCSPLVTLTRDKYRYNIHNYML